MTPKRLATLQDRAPLDLLIVGGGINGAGAAREAAGRGLKVLLVEQEDFAFGASSRSTKLVHGGLRYLEHGDFGLVAEALKERRVLCEVLAPHLTRPLPFLVPVYQGDQRPPWMIRAGLWLYDALAWKGRGLIRGHRWLDSERTRELAPGLPVQGLRGAGEYWDCQMDDARVVLENLADARSLGAQTINYCSLESAVRLKDGDVEVLLRDREQGDSARVRARLLLLCAGAWTDRAFSALGLPTPRPRVHATKGIHLATRRLLDSHALLVPARDGRVFFVLPWDLEGRPASLIGTTDTDFSGDPGHVRAEEDEISYLLREAARILPGEKLGRDDVLATYAGLRPLSAPPERGQGNGAVSREHTFWEEPGVLAVTGGKFTTYRSLCQSLVERAAKRADRSLSAPFSAGRPLPGAPLAGQPSGENLARALATVSGLNRDSCALLARHYGRQAWGLLDLVRADARLGLPLAPGSGCPAILAMATWAAREEQVLHLDDFYLRRTKLGLSLPPDHVGLEQVAEVLGAELAWDARRQDAEREGLARLLRSEYR